MNDSVTHFCKVVNRIQEVIRESRNAAKFAAHLANAYGLGRVVSNLCENPSHGCLQL